MTDPAGARADAEAVAMLAGTDPMLSVNETVVDPAVIVTGTAPERAVVGVQDQLPDASVVAETVWEPTVPLTLTPAEVTPEKVGVEEVTQNCLAP